MDFIRVDQYTLIRLEEYKDVFSLVEGWENREGDFKANWIKQPFGKEKIEKKLPKKIKLGDKQTAIAALQTLLKQLQAETQPESVPEENVPF